MPKMSWDGRSIVKSIRANIRLTFRPIYNWILDNADLLLGRRDMLTPPKRIIALVDVERDYGVYRKKGEEFFRYLIELGGLKPEQNVLDVGSGTGRIAAQLTKYLEPSASYQGLDIVPIGISWCRRKIAPRYPNFHFHLADVYNQSYNPEGRYKASNYRFPYQDGSFDFVFLISVFTHMVRQDMGNYVSEIARVLRKGGRCLITFFLLNSESVKLIESKSSTLGFRYEADGCWTIDANVPERAVAYDEEYIRRLYEMHGLGIVQPILYGSWPGRSNFLSYQDIIIAVRS